MGPFGADSWQNCTTYRIPSRRYFYQIDSPRQHNTIRTRQGAFCAGKAQATASKSPPDCQFLSGLAAMAVTSANVKSIFEPTRDPHHHRELLNFRVASCSFCGGFNLSWVVSHVCANDEHQFQVRSTNRPENIVIRKVLFFNQLSMSKFP
jgi:hypothetical protein